VAESLTDDVQTVTPPAGAAEKKTTLLLAVDSRMASPLRDGDAGAGSVVGDVGTPASPGIIDVDHLSSRPAGADDNLVKD
jgi:hypothetical protein